MSRKLMPLLGLAVALAGACSDSTAPSARQVSLSFSGARPAGVAPSAGLAASAGGSSLLMAPGDSLVLTDGTNTLIITKVQVLLREIELKRANGVDCDSTSNADACEEFEIGARLVTVPLLQAAQTAIAVDIDSGTYSEIEFDIHKLGGDAVDNAFAAANPTWPANTSIRVTGFYNGAPFTFITDLDAEQEIQFVPPLVVGGATSAANVTMRFDLSLWFRNGTTGPLISPATANQGGANKSLVDNNIKNSIKAFEDDDRDGDERDH